MHHYAHHIGDYRPWQPGKWTPFDPCSARMLPKVPAVYAIYVGAELVYVGQTQNLQGRFHGHNIRPGYGNNTHTPWGSFARELMPVTAKAKVSRRFGDWAMIELRLIKRLRPIFNGTFVGKKPREGLYA